MAKFLVYGSYTADGVKGLLKEGGSSRKAAVEKALAGLGGKVEAFYYSFGDNDVYVIVEAPDSRAAIAMSLAVNASGAVTLKTAPLVTADDMDAACKTTVSYRAPGA